jgi:hypothetical protein
MDHRLKYLADLAMLPWAPYVSVPSKPVGRSTLALVLERLIEGDGLDDEGTI